MSLFSSVGKSKAKEVASPKPVSILAPSASTLAASSVAFEPIPQAAQFSGLKLSLEKANRVFLGMGHLKYMKDRNKTSGKLITLHLWNDLLIISKSKRIRTRWAVQTLYLLDEFISISVDPPTGFSLNDSNIKPPRQSFFSAADTATLDQWLSLFRQTNLAIYGKSSLPAGGSTGLAKLRKGSSSSASSRSVGGSLSANSSSFFHGSAANQLPDELQRSLESGMRAITKAEDALKRSLGERGAPSTPSSSSTHASSLSASSPASLDSPMSISIIDPVTAHRRSQLLKMKGLNADGSSANTSMSSSHSSSTSLSSSSPHSNNHSSSSSSASSKTDDQAELLKVAYDAAINLWQSNRQVKLLAERGSSSAVPKPPLRRSVPKKQLQPQQSQQTKQQSQPPPPSSPKDARHLMRQDTMAVCDMIENTQAALLLSDDHEPNGKSESHPDAGTLYEALFEYQPRPKAAKRVHSFQVGDVITMVRPLSDEWAVGRFEARRALFPLPYTRKIADAPKVVSIKLPAQDAPVSGISFLMKAPDAVHPELSFRVDLTGVDLDKLDSIPEAARQTFRTADIIRSLDELADFGGPAASERGLDANNLNLDAIKLDAIHLDEDFLSAPDHVLHENAKDQTESQSKDVERAEIIPQTQQQLQKQQEVVDENDDDENDDDDDDENQIDDDDDDEEEVDDDQEEDEELVDDQEEEEELDDDMKEIRQFEKEAGELASWIELELKRRNQNPKALKNSQVFADHLRIKAIPFLEKFISHPAAVSIIVRVHEALSRYDREVEGAEEKIGLVNKYDLRRLGQSAPPASSPRETIGSDSEDSGSDMSSYSDSDDFDVYQPNFGGGSIYDDI